MNTDNVIDIPQTCLVALVGVTGSGKSTFAARHFAPHEVVSSDACRELITGDANDQSATKDAFEVLDVIVGKRLDRHLLTVVDATTITPTARQSLVALARKHHAIPIAVVLDVPLKLACERTEARTDRAYGAQVPTRQHRELRKSIKNLAKDGFRQVHVLRTQEEIDAVEFRRVPLYVDKRDQHGPFDIIGDVHGCINELVELLRTLGYTIVKDVQGRYLDAYHPQGRTAVFVGDLVDRGPDSAGVLRLVMGMYNSGNALCVPGNHDDKLRRILASRANANTPAALATLQQVREATPESFASEVEDWLFSLPSHVVLDSGALVVAHAGLKESFHMRASGKVREFCLYGDPSGEVDAEGHPIRRHWELDYRGKAHVVYGHTPVATPTWVNRTLCLDTGCVYGGHLSALRWPEKDIVQLPAFRTYAEPALSLVQMRAKAAFDALERPGFEVGAGDVLGDRWIPTDNAGRVKIEAAQAAGAFETLSRWSVDPRWLVYLPPTMSPVETSDLPDFLEHPAQAFSYYRTHGADKVICEEKHMGSRGVIVLTRHQEAATRFFGVTKDFPEGGTVFTRTSRRFFDASLTDTIITLTREAFEEAGLWDELGVEWCALDTEIMPWSLKAEDLIREQYAEVGAAGRIALGNEIAAYEKALDRADLDAETLTRLAARLEKARGRLGNIEGFTRAYGRYAWQVTDLEGLRIAPFQFLGGNGRTWEDQPHTWHMQQASRLAQAEGGRLFMPTKHLVVDVNDKESCAQATQWWLEHTEAGMEGMVVKPVANLVRSKKTGKVVQPGLKVRGREYLRIIYGPDYLDAGNLSRLKRRGVERKRYLAWAEYALGLEALKRAAAGEPLWRVHEAAGAVLALESEEVDPRL
ncbi:MAG: polynucleotide kinase-phosphatase [Actinomycetaceae bacterium]|nr:polynucleotide kinase-phosphatase [Actinomycetaceae bacterium]